MRFYCDGPNITDLLLERRDQGRVVFLCGAGVSIGAGMPDFLGLTAEVMDFFDPPTDSGLFKAFQPWRDATDDDTIPKIPLDQIFQQLYRDYPRNEVNTIIAERLCAENIAQSRHHNILKRLSADQNGKPQIVTTNFDRLFELGSDEQQLSIYEPPAFPNIHLGIPLAGITYLHGRLQEPNATNHPYILSSADLGRAYLAEGWATRFILSLLKNYTVVMVGYSGDDPTVKYLLQGLNQDEKSDRSKLYAFDKGKPEDIEAKWHERGVTPIAFSDFNELWRSLEAWASRADNPRTWRQQIITLAQKFPSDLSPSQRGQVCHLVSTVSGAKLFSRAEPSPPAEWLCVFDAIYRTKVIKSTYEKYEQNQSPYDVYHIDSDTRPSDGNDNSAKAVNLLRWHPNDSNSVAPDGLVNVATPEHYNISNRLYWLMQWINRGIDSPVVIWWLFRQVRLHPSFLLTLKRTVKHNASLPTEARRAWDLLFHYHSTTPHDGIGRCWYDLIHRVQTEGWSVSVLNDLESVTQPLIKVNSPYGHYTHFPPLSGWNEIRFNNLSSLEVSFGRVSADKFNVPDDNVYQVFRILENNLLRAVDLHNPIGIRYRTTPPLSHLRESSSHHHGDEKILGLLLTLFKRLIKLNPTYARAHAEIWSFDESHYFCQLKLFALSQPQLFEADQAIQAVLDLPQETFWRWENRLEILYLIRDRWADISSGKQSKIITFLLNGRSDSGYEDQEEKYRYHRPCAYITWLQQNGCNIAPEQAELLNQITQKLDEWNDEWVNALEAKDRSVGWVRKNTNADSISNLPISQISDAATEQTTHDFSSFTDHQPFSGLVQQQPRKALAALSHKARNNEYPKERWSDLIEEWPKDLSTKSPRLYRVFLLRLKKLPAEIIQRLAHTLSSWISENFTTAYNFDQTLAWELFFYIVDCLQSIDGAKVSDIGISRNGKPISSKTYFHAINSPMGKMTRGLFQALYSQKLSSGQGLPNSFEIQLTNLLNCRGEGLDHVVCILSYHFTWLYRIDPKWSTAIIVSWLNFEHSHSEAAWNGLVNSHRFHPKLIVLVRAQLIRLLPKLHDWECDQDLQISATKLIMEICYKQHGCFPPLISASETKNILRQVSDENRQEAIRWLNIIGQEDPEKWEVICSFIDSTWPRERQFRTASLAGRWVDLLSDTGRHFPDVYQSVQRFLVPTSCHSLYEFSRDDSHEKTLTSLYPEIVLDMLDRMTSDTISELSYQIGEVLPLITEAQPELEGDRRYQRLIGLLDQV